MSKNKMVFLSCVISIYLSSNREEHFSLSCPSLLLLKCWQLAWISHIMFIFSSFLNRGKHCLPSDHVSKFCLIANIRFSYTKSITGNRHRHSASPQRARQQQNCLEICCFCLVTTPNNRWWTPAAPVLLAVLWSGAITPRSLTPNQ